MSLATSSASISWEGWDRVVFNVPGGLEGSDGVFREVLKLKKWPEWEVNGLPRPMRTRSAMWYIVIS